MAAKDVKSVAILRGDPGFEPKTPTRAFSVQILYVCNDSEVPDSTLGQDNHCAQGGPQTKLRATSDGARSYGYECNHQIEREKPSALVGSVWIRGGNPNLTPARDQPEVQS